MAYKPFQEQALYQSIEDLAAWLIPAVGKWNKWLRPTLGQQVLVGVLSILRCCTMAYGAARGQKLGHLERASAELDGLRMLVKLSVTLRLSSRSQFKHASRLMGEVGKQLGGWMGLMRRGEGE